MVTAVPAFFGSKARTRKPAAVDVTVLFDTSGSNSSFIAAFKDKTNISSIESALAAESVGTGTALNRYSIGGFRNAFFADTNPNKVFIDSSEISGASWGVTDANYLLGAHGEDETGAIYAIARPGGPRGSLGAFRSKSDNIARIVISESTEEDAGVTNGQELDFLMRTEASQILVFIDGYTEDRTRDRDAEPTISPSQLSKLIQAGTVPGRILSDGTGVSESRVYGFVFTGQNEATVIFSPKIVTSGTQLSNLTIVKNIPKRSLSCQGYNAGQSSGPNNDGDIATNTGHYAELTGGAVLALTACTPNFPLAFEVLGKILGELLYDASL
jgi:hypothetical protein